jgi:hypothetical protein
MPFSEMWHDIGLVGTDVSEERVAFIFKDRKVERISELRTTLGVSGN